MNNTFISLYEHLRTHVYKNVGELMNDPLFENIEIQESLLRLFFGLGLIDKLNGFYKCIGNFNKMSITPLHTLDELFYCGRNIIYLKDKGDVSDLTGFARNDNKHILATTSKNMNKYNIGDLDIERIMTVFDKYDGYKLTLCICIPCREDYEQILMRVNNTSQYLLDITQKYNTIIIDWVDLYYAYWQFKRIYVLPLSNIIGRTNNILQLKAHQQWGVSETMRLKDNNVIQVLWGHIARSGKSYIMAGCIIVDSMANDNNYLIITTAPNETIEQYFKVFDCAQLCDFDITHVSAKTRGKPKGAQNIIICSKQYLQGKKITWLHNMKFSMRFIDESHHGGSTELAKNILNHYGDGAFTVMISATYAKPVCNYGIVREAQILWDLEDVRLCKNLKDPHNKMRLREKHGEDFIALTETYDMSGEYNKYPDLYLLTDELLGLKEIMSMENPLKYGWSPEAILMNKDGTFCSEGEALKIWYKIFGNPKDKIPIAESFMNRVRTICINENSRRIPYYIVDNDKKVCKPLIIIAFLPQNNINELSCATKNLLEAHNIIPNFEIVCINSKIGNNPKELIEEAQIRAAHKGREGVLVLSGRQCSLGVSLRECDIVLLLNSNTSFDMIYQMMFRSMTEAPDKKCGFVIDLDIGRAIKSCVEYAMIVRPNLQPLNAIEYILRQRLIAFNADEWIMHGCRAEARIMELSKKLYDMYIYTDVESALRRLINRLPLRDITLSNDEKKLISAMFKNTLPKKIIKLENTDKLEKGIEKTKLNKSEPKLADEDKNSDVKYMDMLKHIIPLMCLLTIKEPDVDSFIDMYKCIISNGYIGDIFIEQTRTWWGKSITKEIIRRFIDIYIKYMVNNVEINNIIKVIKELFVAAVGNRHKLSQIIDDYLIPQELEKKINAEISTPYKLRQKMLDKIPRDFWMTPHKVFEPCAGKGGFLLDIIDRFMEGLSDVDEKNRYRIIVEECLYFADINSTNIFVCKLLIDPNNQYKLNYYEGDTLLIDVNREWNITRFDAVIGNPPYNEDPNNSNDPHMKPVYQNWIFKFNEISDKLLFITPSKWFTAQGKDLVKLRKYMCQQNVIFIKHYPEQDIFKDVKITGGVSYYLIDKTANYDMTRFNGNNINLAKYDIIIEPKYYTIINHLADNGYFAKTLDELYSPQSAFITSKTEKEFTDDPGDDTILCFVSQNKGFKKYISADKVQNNFNYWKIATACAGYGGISGFANTFIINCAEIHSRSYISFRANSETEANSLFSYLKCKLAHILLSARKTTHLLTNVSLFKWIPLIPLDRIWDNDSLHAYFKLEEKTY